MQHQKRALAVIGVIGLLLLGACSSGSGGRTRAGNSGSSGEGSSGALSSTGGSGGSATGQDATDASRHSDASGDDSAYCQKAEQFADFDSSANAGELSDISSEELVEKYIQRTEELRKLAPKQLQASYDAVVALYKKYRHDPAGLTSLSTDDSTLVTAEKAFTKIAEYNTTTCGTSGF